MFYVSILVTILGLTVYQIAMKTAPHNVSPFSLLAIVYLFAAVACAAIAPAWWKLDGLPLVPQLSARILSAAAYIAASVILIEVGYLLVYKSGWSISVAPAVGQAVTLSVLAIVSYAVMGELMSFTRILGLLLCVGGVVLITRKA